LQYNWERMSDFDDFEDIVSILVFGDTHFKPRDFEAGEELIAKAHEVATQLTPTAIILLGDTMDTHETAKNAPWKQACRFIEGLSEIAPTYVIIGNHDLINQSQFLTDNHFFDPLKKWPNVTIIDKPLAVQIGGYNIVLCPYVPPGRFEEALDMMAELGGCEEEFDWRNETSCVFAHQEIEGVEYNGIVSTKGDRWAEEYPPLICGHIHTPFQIGENVFYPGSSRQVDSNENPDKRIWNVSFDEEGQPEFDKIDMCLKGRKEVEMTCENIGDFDFELAEKYYVKVKLQGTPEQFKIFRKSQMHAKMMQNGVKFGFNPIKDDSALSLAGYDGTATTEDLSFTAILRELVKSKPEVVQSAYEELYDEVIEDEIGVELVFGDQE
jgi:DNA repair exonuclease SbcCD nuclease subunit